MKKKVITGKVNETFISSIAKLGQVRNEPDYSMYNLPPIEAEEAEYMLDVSMPDFYEGEAFATLVVYDQKTVFVNLMFFADCQDERIANAAAEKYHEDMGDDFVWGFSEEFYPDDAMRITTTFEYKDEESLSAEIESRFNMWTQKDFLDKIKPIIKYFQ